MRYLVPIERLFNPEVCVMLGAAMATRAKTSEERGPPLATEPNCRIDYPSNCSFERQWKRRLRVYNAGTETAGWEYAEDIVLNSNRYVPQREEVP